MNETTGEEPRITERPDPAASQLLAKALKGAGVEAGEVDAGGASGLLARIRTSLDTGEQVSLGDS